MLMRVMLPDSKMSHRLPLLVLITYVVFHGCNGQIGQFNPVDEDGCPTTVTEWRKQEANRNCPAGTKYHCVPNQYGDFGEVCFKESWVQPGYCPEFNTEAKKINVKECKPFDNYRCPVEAFHSNEAFKHIICLKMPPPPTTTSTEMTTTQMREKIQDEGSSAGAIAAVVVILLIFGVLIGGVIVFIWYCRRNTDFRKQMQKRVPILEGILDRVLGALPKEVEEEEKLTKVQDNPDNPKEIEEYQEERQPEDPKWSNPYFLQTNVHHRVIELLEEHDAIVVVGKTGIGKTSLCVGVLDYYRHEREWNVIDLSVTRESTEILAKTIIFVDSYFGDFPLYYRYTDFIQQILSNASASHKLGKAIKLLIACTDPLTDDMKSDKAILKDSFELVLDKSFYSEDEIASLQEKYGGQVISEETETRKWYMSGYSLPKLCYIQKDNDPEKQIERHQDEEVTDILIDYVSWLAKASATWRTERYHTLVLMLFNGAVLQENDFKTSLTKKLGFNLQPHAIRERTLDLVGDRLLQFRNETYTFSNDFILNAVLTTYAEGRENLMKFVRFAYYPFVVQLLCAKKTPHQKSRFCVELIDDLELYVELTERPYREGRHPLPDDHPLMRRFLELLTKEEKKVSDKHPKKPTSHETVKGKLIRNMLMFHPYMKKYYERKYPNDFATLNQDKLNSRNKQKEKKKNKTKQNKTECEGVFA